MWTFPKILTNTFFLGIGVNHRVPQLADKSTHFVRPKKDGSCNTIYVDRKVEHIPQYLFLSLLNHFITLYAKQVLWRSILSRR
ncbi:hypothetical protein DF213_16445 [Dickeya dianthicola]|uniref:Uncharacterized protein n=1 Tax=Dickeya dianthicola TaxID=204039 RepID=A0AAX1C3C1_9GAMM|nr:hypothetical protein DF213_16445 [Dickeya dianthicola]